MAKSNHSKIKNASLKRKVKYLGCANIAQLFWCHRKALYECKKDNAMFKMKIESLRGSQVKGKLGRRINMVFPTSDNDNFDMGINYQTTQAKSLPTCIDYFKWHDYYIVVSPDGVTEQLCYEFKATHFNEGIARKFVAPVAVAQANLYSFFFRRPRYEAEIYLVAEDKKISYKGMTDKAKAERMLQDLDGLLKGNQKPIPPRPWKCKNCSVPCPLRHRK